MQTPRLLSRPIQPEGTGSIKGSPGDFNTARVKKYCAVASVEESVS